MSNWRLEAACRGMDVAMFFADDDRREQPDGTIKALCASCDVSAECLADALEDPSTMGIRAGMTFAQRRRERYARGMNIRQPTGHGTYAGYRAHQKAGSLPCNECKTAGGKYLREWRLQRSGFGKA